jgi:outer membrane lipase/esterase
MPAVLLGTDWATASVGTSVRLGHGITGYAMFLSEVGQANAAYYGAQLGVNVALNAWTRPARAF